MDRREVVWYFRYRWRLLILVRCVGRNQRIFLYRRVLLEGREGGQAIGATNQDGTKVVERPLQAQDVLASAFFALGLDAEHTNYTREGRPLQAVDKSGKVIGELFAG